MKPCAVGQTEFASLGKDVPPFVDGFHSIMYNQSEIWVRCWRDGKGVDDNELFHRQNLI